MIKPPYLTKGDKVLLVSPAGKTTLNEVQPAMNDFKSWGLNVEISPNAIGSHYTFSAKKHLRLQDFQRALDDTAIKAIFCTRGGYGAIHLIDKLDFSRFKQSPKWLIGYSDVTIFHLYLNTLVKCESLHALMPKDVFTYADYKCFDRVKDFLFGKEIKYQLYSHRQNISGKASGILVGGNLSTLISLLGTPFLKNINHKILFIEEIGENLHHLDRMMYQLKLSGILPNLKGLIVGGMTKMKGKASFGKSSYDVISDLVTEYSYPVIFNFPAGHQKKNFPLPMGRKVFVEVSKSKTFFTFSKN